MDFHAAHPKPKPFSEIQRCSLPNAGMEPSMLGPWKLRVWGCTYDRCQSPGPFLNVLVMEISDGSLLGFWPPCT